MHELEGETEIDELKCDPVHQKPYPEPDRYLNMPAGRSIPPSQVHGGDAGTGRADRGDVLGGEGDAARSRFCVLAVLASIDSPS